MADEQARPLTAEEIEAIRRTLAAGVDPRYPADAFARQAATRLLATLDAWRESMRQMADYTHATVSAWDRGDWDEDLPFDPQEARAVVSLARRLLDQDS